jgi:hypothetical protein
MIFFSCQFHKKWLIYLSSKNDFENNWLFWLTRFIICRLNRCFWAWCWSLTWWFILNVQRFHFAREFSIRLIFIQCRAWSDNHRTRYLNFFFSIRAKTSNSIVLVFIMQLKVFESFKRAWFDTKYINHWSLDKIAQNGHEISSFVVRNWKFDEIASH